MVEHEPMMFHTTQPILVLPPGTKTSSPSRARGGVSAAKNSVEALTHQLKVRPIPKSSVLIDGSAKNQMIGGLSSRVHQDEQRFEEHSRIDDFRKKSQERLRMEQNQHPRNSQHPKQQQS